MEILWSDDSSIIAKKLPPSALEKDKQQIDLLNSPSPIIRRVNKLTEFHIRMCAYGKNIKINIVDK